MNEADTRARLIEPKLKAAGWTDQQVTREFYYNRDYQYTRGHIILVGDRIRRGAARKVDYLLRVSESFPIAVVEAKAEKEPAEAGLEQAKEYARDLGLAFAYSTNGRGINARKSGLRCGKRPLRVACLKVCEGEPGGRRLERVKVN